MLSNLSKKRTFSYTWVIILLCFLTTFTTLGFCSSNKSLYLVAITDALHIPRSLFSLSDSLRFITTAVVNLFFSRLAAKFGFKKLLCFGFLSLIASVLINAVSSSVYLFYLGGIFLGLGFCFTGTTIIGSIVHRWCAQNKGTIMGFVLAANGLGGAVAAQIVSPIIYEEGNPFGYRNAYFLVAGILVAVMILIIIFFREKPKNMGEETTEAPKKHPPKDAEGTLLFEKVWKTPFFFAILACIFFTGFVLTGVNGIAAGYLKDLNLDSSYIATVLSVHSVTLALFKFLTGFIYDKFGLRVTMTICSIAAVLSMLSLVFITNSPSGYVLAMFWGVVSSLSLPLETIMLPLYAGGLFKATSFNKALSLFVSVNTAGYALGSPLTNIFYDLTGSYVPAFCGNTVIMFIVFVVMSFLLKKVKTIQA